MIKLLLHGPMGGKKKKQTKQSAATLHFGVNPDF